MPGKLVTVILAACALLGGAREQQENKCSAKADLTLDFENRNIHLFDNNRKIIANFRPTVPYYVLQNEADDDIEFQLSIFLGTQDCPGRLYIDNSGNQITLAEFNASQPLYHVEKEDIGSRKRQLEHQKFPAYNPYHQFKEKKKNRGKKPHN